MLAALPADVHLHDACKTFTAVRTGYQVLHFGGSAVEIPDVKPPTWQPVIFIFQAKGACHHGLERSSQVPKISNCNIFGFLTWVEGCRCPMLRKRL